MSVTAQQTPVTPSSPFVASTPSSHHQYQSPANADSPRTTQTRSNKGGSPHSSRRPSRKQSGNSSKVNNLEPPQQAPGYSPGGSQRSASSTPRVHELPKVTKSSPAAALTASPALGQTSQGQARDQRDYSNGPPFAPPPRTSSNQRPQDTHSPLANTLPDRTSSNQISRDTSQHINLTSTSPQLDQRHKTLLNEHGDTQKLGNSGERDVEAAITVPSRQKPPDPALSQQLATASRESRPRQSPSSSQKRPVTQTTGSTPRSAQQDTDVLKRVVVTDPAIDLAREQERQSEAVPISSVDETPRNDTQRRQDYSGSVSSPGRRKETKFGEYILGQTLGEGEFGKVKLGWKKDGSVQVAIKLIRLEALGTNPNRLPKIYREISILRDLSHPNIVRLHEMVETKAYIGIILEYASGGELFDYILNQRYLKDNSARRLFAQLVSGVGYLHKKGIVHRDLKLENLLLDRHKNIIITDFGFANNFDPQDELGEEIEWSLADREYVKRRGLDQVTASGSRRGDLMQTSCGSPCYAAPELVVTDSLYTGRKVDVWSCGVILYAMLAGYLPFDDDPANPEGDNINLLYKYIVSTPLTFPEYVTPHARDLLRRILVPDPRKRADLFEVARHSWLSDYAHVVAHVTSSTTTAREATSPVALSQRTEAPPLARSASVREPTKSTPSNLSPVGGLSHQGNIGPEVVPEKSKSSARDPKRRTVQVEYVAPQSQTARGEVTSNTASPVQHDQKSRNAPPTAAQNGISIDDESTARRKVASAASSSKPLPQEPSSSRDRRSAQAYHDPRVEKTTQSMAPPVRPAKDMPRSVSDSTGAFASGSYTVRPATGGSIPANSSNRMPSRGNSYSQPLAPTVAATNAQGRLSQPKNGKQYNISAPIPQSDPYYNEESIGRPYTQNFTQNIAAAEREPRGHKRSNTFGNVFGRSASIFGRSQPKQEESNKLEKRYPPTSMKVPIASDSPRQSMESRRSSFGFGRKNSDLRKSSEPKPEKNRRFSLLPASFSFKGLSGSTKDLEASLPVTERRPSTMQQAPASRGESRPQTTNTSKGRAQYTENPNVHGVVAQDLAYDAYWNRPKDRNPRSNGVIEGQQRQYSNQYGEPHARDDLSKPLPGQSYYLDGQGTPGESLTSLGTPQHRPVYPEGFNSYEDVPQSSAQQGRRERGVLQKNNRKFADAYEEKQQGHHSGSSGAARRVMDFFRRRGKARAEDDRV